jgi:hypothetical protein
MLDSCRSGVEPRCRGVRVVRHRSRSFHLEPGVPQIGIPHLSETEFQALRRELPIRSFEVVLNLFSPEIYLAAVPYTTLWLLVPKLNP